MSGCSKRCKHGIVKFAQTIFKLITGTLSKGKRVKGALRSGLCCAPGCAGGVLQALRTLAVEFVAVSSELFSFIWGNWLLRRSSRARTVVVR